MFKFRTVQGAARFSHRPSRTFFRFLLAYCLILAVPCALAFSLYSGLVSRTERYVVERTMSGLGQTQQIVDHYLEQMRWNAIRISENSKLRMILAAARAGMPISNYDVKEVIDVLFDNVAYQNDLTTTCYVYVKNPSLILTPDTAYHPEFYFDYIVRSEVEGQIFAWHEEVDSHYVAGKFYTPMSVRVEEPGNRLDVIPYVQSLPAGFKSSPDGYLAYFINANTVRKLLSQIEVGADGWICILDADNEVLSIVDGSAGLLADDLTRLAGETGIGNIDMPGEHMKVMFVTSNASGWKYVAAFPESFPRDLVRRIARVTWLAFALMVLIGLTCACLLAYRDSKPVDAIFGMMRDAFGGGGYDQRYSRIDRNVSNIILRSSSLQRLLQMKTDFLRSVFVERLLKGRFADGESLVTMLDRADLHVSSELYLVVLMQTGDPPGVEDHALLYEVQQYRESVRETVSRVFPCLWLTYDLSEDTTLLLLGLEESDEVIYVPKVDEWVKEGLSQLHDTAPAHFVFAVGEPVHDLLSVNSSFEQALEALGYRSNGDRVVFFSSIGVDHNDYYYPLELESRLLGAIQSGNRGGVEQALSTIWRHNHETRALPLETRRALLGELYGTLHRLRVPNGNRTVWQAIRRSHGGDTELSIDAAFSDLRRHILSVCDEIRDRRRSRTEELLRAVTDYLGDHIDDPQLSLRGTAEQFGLTEAYLSAFFKQRMGSNFSRYVENRRLELAAQHLLETNLPINVIAKEVGYNSDKAFRRAFKRVHGVSPVIFRLHQRSIAMGR